MTPDFSRICRLCLIEEYSLVPIFDEGKQGRQAVPLSQQMMTIASLKVKYQENVSYNLESEQPIIKFLFIVGAIVHPNAHTRRLFTSADRQSSYRVFFLSLFQNIKAFFRIV